MKNTNKYALLWSAAGLFFSLMALLVVITGLSGKVFITDPEGIPQAANQILSCVQSGDWETLQKSVVGTPSLDLETGGPGSAEAILWDAYQKSFLWSIENDYSVSGPYVMQSVTVTCLDIPEVTRQMAGVLVDPSFNAELPGDDPLIPAARQVLKSGTPLKQCEITLTFQREKRQWLLVPNSAFQALLSGFSVR